MAIMDEHDTNKRYGQSSTGPVLHEADAQALRAAVALRQEDLLEELTTHPAAAPLNQQGFDWGPLIQALGPYILQLIGQIISRPPAPPAPPVVEPAPPTPPAPPAPPTQPPVGTHRIVGGKARLTGITEGGPLGKRIAGERLDQIKAGTANAPHDSRFEFDFTPTFEDGHIGQPSGPGEPDDPYFAQTPSCPAAPGDTVAPTQAVRLRFDAEGLERADLSREYAANGCTPRIRAIAAGDAGGTLADLRFDFYGGSVSVEGVDEIHVGRGA